MFANALTIQELSVISGNLRAAEAKYNRELRFFAMSQKVAHLDPSAASKRDSTIQSFASLQQRVDVAEKVCGASRPLLTG
jgi:hypothetical protein